MIVRIVFICTVLALIGTVSALRSGTFTVSDHINPWAPLTVDAEPNFLTRFKLARLSKDPALCRHVLESTNLSYSPIPNQTTGHGCGFHDAVRIEHTSAEIGEPFSLSCRAAVSLALWEHHGLQPLASKHFDQPIAQIEHYGSYACRNVYGFPRATRSRHATAEAFDLAGFVLEDGTRIRVVNDWKSGDARGEFLQELRDSACLFFDGVLTPDYNEAHKDHFHLDRGPYRVCR